MTLNGNSNVASTWLCACHVCCCITAPPSHVHVRGLRAAQNGRFLVTFFVNKYRDLFCDQRGGGSVISTTGAHPQHLPNCLGNFRRLTTPATNLCGTRRHLPVLVLIAWPPQALPSEISKAVPTLPLHCGHT